VRVAYFYIYILVTKDVPGARPANSSTRMPWRGGGDTIVSGYDQDIREKKYKIYLDMVAS
jgi:hypothetical protein